MKFDSIKKALSFIVKTIIGIVLIIIYWFIFIFVFHDTELDEISDLIFWGGLIVSIALTVFTLNGILWKFIKYLFSKTNTQVKKIKSKIVETSFSKQVDKTATTSVTIKSINDNLVEIDNMDGHAFEHWCAHLLRANGYINVIVTRGSGDHGVDVLAEKDGIRYAVQCKCYSNNLSNTPVQEVFAGKEMYDCHVGVVMTNREFTEGAKMLAEKDRVLLWGRSKIIELLENVEKS